MELPSDLDKDDEWGIHISVIQEADKNRYSAYCSYFDEEIFFEAKNAEPDKSSPSATVISWWVEVLDDSENW